jgi:hypothetical protein
MVGRHVQLFAVGYDADISNPAHKLSVEDCMFNMVNAGIYIRGNTYVSDTTDNRGWKANLWCKGIALFFY